MAKQILRDLHGRSPQARTDSQTPSDALSRDTIAAEAGHLAEGPAGVALSLIYLKNGHLEAGHELANSIGGRDGDASHALMHRMEGDFGNTRYWHRRAGEHPTHRQLAEDETATSAAQAAGIPELVAAGVYDPGHLTAAIESGNPGLQAAATTLHNIEMDALFDWCLEQLDE